jgi:hypothetical protein
MTLARLSFLIAALALSGCYAKKAAPRLPGTGGTGSPAFDAATADDGALGGDGGRDVASADGGPDGSMGNDGAGPGVDAAPFDIALPDHTGDASPSEAYQQFADDEWTIWSQRWAACFDASLAQLDRASSPLGEDFPELRVFSLQHGLSRFDASKAQACLTSLAALSCDQLLRNEFDPPCRQAVVGQVATEGYCVTNEDCQSAADDCQARDVSGCISRCAPRVPAAAVGETCDDRPCGFNAVCHADPAGNDPSRCVALDAEGSTCNEQSCVDGAWCKPASADITGGVCQHVVAGGTCQGSWQCPVPYACLIPAGSTSGTCGPGRKQGEVCTLQGIATVNGPFTDCAVSLFCYPDSTNHFVCGVGRELGESCGDMDVGGMNPLSVPCRQGVCRADAGGNPHCVLDGKEGEACSGDRPCDVGFGCDTATGKCHTIFVKVGEHCTLDGLALCPDGSRCAVSAADATQGTCLALKKMGEACNDPDDCALGLSCTSGTCMACK